MLTKGKKYLVWSNLDYDEGKRVPLEFVDEHIEPIAFYLSNAQSFVFLEFICQGVRSYARLDTITGIQEVKEEG